MVGIRPLSAALLRSDGRPVATSSAAQRPSSAMLRAASRERTVDGTVSRKPATVNPSAGTAHHSLAKLRPQTAKPSRSSLAAAAMEESKQLIGRIFDLACEQLHCEPELVDALYRNLQSASMNDTEVFRRILVSLEENRRATINVLKRVEARERVLGCIEEFAEAHFHVEELLSTTSHTTATVTSSSRGQLDTPNERDMAWNSRTPGALQDGGLRSRRAQALQKLLDTPDVLDEYMLSLGPKLSSIAAEGDAMLQSLTQCSESLAVALDEWDQAKVLVWKEVDAPPSAPLGASPALVPAAGCPVVANVASVSAAKPSAPFVWRHVDYKEKIRHDTSAFLALRERWSLGHLARVSDAVDRKKKRERLLANDSALRQHNEEIAAKAKEEFLNAAAVTIQSAFRMHRAAMWFQLIIMQKKSVRRICTWWRGMKTRQRFVQATDYSKAALALQRLWRGFVARRQFPVMLSRHRAARKIQRWWRFWDCHFRMIIRKLERHHRLAAAAIVVRAVRAFLRRVRCRHAVQRRDAVKTIQRWCRCRTSVIAAMRHIAEERVSAAAVRLHPVVPHGMTLDQSSVSSTLNLSIVQETQDSLHNGQLHAAPSDSQSTSPMKLATSCAEMCAGDNDGSTFFREDVDGNKTVAAAPAPIPRATAEKPLPEYDNVFYPLPLLKSTSTFSQRGAPPPAVSAPISVPATDGLRRPSTYAKNVEAVSLMQWVSRGYMCRAQCSTQRKVLLVLRKEEDHQAALRRHNMATVLRYTLTYLSKCVVREKSRAWMQRHQRVRNVALWASWRLQRWWRRVVTRLHTTRCAEDSELQGLQLLQKSNHIRTTGLSTNNRAVEPAALASRQTSSQDRCTSMTATIYASGSCSAVIKSHSSHRSDGPLAILSQRQMRVSRFVEQHDASGFNVADLRSRKRAAMRIACWAKRILDRQRSCRLRREKSASTIARAFRHYKLARSYFLRKRQRAEEDARFSLWQREQSAQAERSRRATAALAILFWYQRCKCNQLLHRLELHSQIVMSRPDRDANAARIQRFWRVARDRLFRLHRARVERDLQQTKRKMESTIRAAVLIQSRFRAFVKRDEIARRREAFVHNRTIAAVVIQKHVRRWLATRTFWQQKVTKLSMFRELERLRQREKVRLTIGGVAPPKPKIAW